MGWVTLTLRKRELKVEHARYQLRDLQISREKRQLAREKSLNQSIFKADQQAELSAIRSEYQATRNNLTANGITAEASAQLSNAQFDYQSQVDAIKTFYEGECEILEQEAADREAELDEEQVTVEAQMEAISQEMQAVSDAISSQIQSSTIKLA